MEKFARKCDITGKGMNEGYVFGDGDMYASDKPSAIKIATEHYGYDSLSDCHDHEMVYYTEWEEVDEDEWYDADGFLYEYDMNLN